MDTLKEQTEEDDSKAPYVHSIYPMKGEYRRKEKYRKFDDYEEYEDE